MTEGPAMPPLLGRRLGDYTIEAVVGRGGMATVYRARDQRLGRAVALKVLAPQLAHDDRFRDRFVRESRLVASIDHPNIIPIYEAGERDELLFIAMRYVEGSDMRKLIQSAGPMPVGRANPLFAQIASALDAAHANGLVHRDVKPANILVTEADHVYLTDFGLTKSSSAEAGLTSHGHFMGTPRYVAPEQIRGLQVDGRSDLYAFACVVYEALAGQPPFQRDTELALLYAHVSHDPPPLTPYRPDLPHAVNAVMARALAKTPVDRFMTCQAFVSALRDAISGVVDDPSGYPQEYTFRSPAPQSYPPVSRPQVSRPPVSQPPLSHPSQTDAGYSHGSYHHTSYPPGAGTSTETSGASVAGGPHTAPGAGTRRRFPYGPVIGGLAVLVSVAVAATLLLTRGGDTAATWKTYPGTTAAPFKMNYLAAWGDAKTNSDQWMIASPARDDFEALFAVPGNTDWSKVDPIISGHPERATGVFAQVSNTLSTSDSPVDIQQSLQSSLPGNVGYGGAPLAATIGARPGFKISGVLTDPQQTTSLKFTTYLVRQEAAGSTVLITFFCPPAKCDTENIQHMVDSITFTS
ncbi:protein kinase [Microbispora sp. NPDC049125]|uniref:serine/threonine-protein kinase n=1 Tax=Microbispora sp. NPDC049125 TaxID=3154929 RepID=UPI003466761F